MIAYRRGAPRRGRLGTGRLLAPLRPKYGVGVDMSLEMLAIAQAEHPDLEFVESDIEDPAVVRALRGSFDVVVMSDTIGLLDDCQATLDSLRQVCDAETRLIIGYYNYLWDLRLVEWTGLRMPSSLNNWLKPADRGKRTFAQENGAKRCLGRVV